MANSMPTFGDFVGGLFVGAFTKTLESFGWSVETALVSLLCLAFVAGAWAWTHGKSEGWMTLPAGALAKVRAVSVVTLAGAAPIILMFGINILRVAHEGDVNSRTEIQRLKGMPDNAQPQSPVLAENPDHADELRELRPLKDERDRWNQERQNLERKLQDARDRLAVQEKLINDKDRLNRTVNELSKYAAEFELLRQACGKTEPAEYKQATNRTLQEAVNYLLAQGRPNDAQRLAQNYAPPGMPRFVTPNCDLYNETDNRRIASRMLVAGYIVNDIIDRLSR